MLQPLALSRLPTPIDHLARTSARLGVDIYVKRDDLTGLGLSGNKVRKLDWLLAAARRDGADHVITCGGIQSNHCRATVVAARRVGMDVTLLLRGRPVVTSGEGGDGPQAAGLDGNLLLDAMLGARVEWVSPEGYADRHAGMRGIADRLRARGARPYVIPEGGSDGVGSQGFVAAAAEVSAQCDAMGVRFDSVIFAVGSGGTLAGLAMGAMQSRVLGVAVCDDAATFRARVEEIGAQPAPAPRPALPPYGAGWEVVEGFQGRGYGLTTPEQLREQALLARESGLILDPVYTGKAWLALAQMARNGDPRLGKRVLFWHTGGAFGWFGRGQELQHALGDELAELGYIAQV